MKKGISLLLALAATALVAANPRAHHRTGAPAYGRVIGQNRLALLTPSGTRSDLTKSVGGVKEGTPAFVRDVPGDYIQGPSDANFMIKNLKVKKVVIMDFQEPYSLGLASAVETTLKAGGVSTV